MAQQTVTQTVPAFRTTPNTCSERSPAMPALSAQLCRQHNRRLYRIARSILRNNADAEDAVQDAYVSAFTNLASYRGEVDPCELAVPNRYQ